VYSATRGGMSLIENRFFIVRITDPNTKPERHLLLLSRENVGNGNLQRAWEDALADRQVREAAVRLFSPEPDRRLVNLVKKTLDESAALLTSERIRESLSRIHRQLISQEGTAVSEPND